MHSPLSASIEPDRFNTSKVTRRHWLRQAGLLSAAALASRSAYAGAGEQTAKPFTLDLTVWKLGIPGNQDDAIRWAGQFGFESVGAHTGEISAWTPKDFDAYAEVLSDKKLQWGTSSMPVDFRNDEDRFKDGIRKLPQQAQTLAKAGVKSAITYIMPCHNDLTYLENFKIHRRRLAEIGRVLSDHGLRFGMEYVGTESLRNRRKFPFIHTLREGLELIDAIGLDTVGLVMDCWHWHNAQDTAEDLKLLEPKHVVSVELNDAPVGIDRPFLQDGTRELPVATGVIDTAGFLNGLAAQGVKAPLMAEPFNRPFRDMPRETGLAVLARSLRKAMDLLA